MEFTLNATFSRHGNMDLLNFALCQPDESKLVQVLRDGLKENFAEVAVEWVYSSDLTQKPFNSVAPGLCGSKTILQVGGTGYLLPYAQRERTYLIKDLVEILGRRDIYSFIIGGCICPRPLDARLGELCTNMSFSPISNGMREFRSLSSLIFWNEEMGNCYAERLHNVYDNVCSTLGNFFISEGNIGQVLQIYAKRRIGNMGFMDSMQYALSKNFAMHFPVPECIGLGGVFAVNNAVVRHHVMPHNDWYVSVPTINNVHAQLRYFDMSAPTVISGLLINSSQLLLESIICGNMRRVCLTSQQFHSINDDGHGGYFHMDITPDTAEYFGYFSVADNMVLIDSNVHNSMAEFSHMKFAL